MPVKDSISRSFVAIASFSTRRPAVVLLAAAGALLLSIFSLWHTPFFTDMTELLPATSSSIALTRELIDTFKLGNRTEIAAEGNLASLAPFARAVKEELAASPLVLCVITTYAEQYDVGNDPTSIARLIVNLPPMHVERIARYLTPEGMRDAIAAWQHEQYGMPEEVLRGDPLFLRTFVSDKILAKSAPLWFTNRLRTSNDRRWVHITVVGKESAADLAFSRAITQEVDGALDRARSRTPGISRVIQSGSSVTSVSNQRSIRRDIFTTILVTSVLVLALFFFVFRRFTVLLLVGVTLFVSVACAFGIAGGVLGKIFLGTVVFASILIGLGIDFPLHLCNQLAIESRRHAGWREAIAAAAAAVGPGVFGAALTTVAVFLVLALCHFRPLVEMGLVAAIGIALCALSTFTVLPALFSLRGGSATRGLSRAGETSPFLQGVVTWSLRHPAAVRRGSVAFIGLLAVLALLRAGPGLQLSSGIAQFQSTPPEVMRQRDELETLFPPEAKPQIVIVYHARDRREAYERALSLQPVLDSAIISGHAVDYFSPLRFFKAPRVYAHNYALVMREIQPRPLVMQFDAEVRRAERDPAEFETTRQFLLSLQAALEDPALADPLGDLSSPIWSHSIAASGGGAIGAIPILIDPLKNNSSDLSHALRFLEGKLSSLPGGWAELAGWAPLQRDITLLIKEDLFRALLISALLVVGIALLFFRRVIPTAIALTPVALAFIATLCVMKLAAIPLTSLSIAAFPIILGIGIDDGIHLVSRASATDFQEIAGPFATTGRAIVLTTLTTMSAFGSCITSWNGGLRGLAWALNTGLLVSLAASLVLLPALIALATKHRVLR